jgi:hypothetical protein
MRGNINHIVKAISAINNQYRDPAACVRAKLEALWEMGDQLISMGVSNPHSVGWAVQKETNGLIKRPTVFRSHKIRTIWSSKETLLKDLGQLPRLSHLTEILPLIDPAQPVRHRLSTDELEGLYKHACCDPPQAFRQYLGTLKRKYSHGRLGRSLDRAKHLDQLQNVVSDFRALRNYLLKILDQAEPTERQQFRIGTLPAELRAFSNMCISLTTKDNYRLFKNTGPSMSNSRNIQFNRLYNCFRELLGKKGDVERARLRRLISADALAQMSDMVSSLISEDGVVDFRNRRDLTISL